MLNPELDNDMLGSESNNGIIKYIIKYIIFTKASGCLL